MADGSIIIDTRIDTGGVSKGMNAVKAGMTRILRWLDNDKEFAEMIDQIAERRVI